MPPGALVIAADSGLDHAVALGVHVDVAVGDFDSVDPRTLRRAVDAGVEVTRHPTAKDATDLELALDRALAAGAGRVVVVGGHGGRFDHLLANALLLAAPRYASMVMEAHVGAARLHVVRAQLRVVGTPGELVSLLALHGPAHGVRTSGLRFALHDETLLPGSSRGVSNLLVAEQATVRVRAGVLLVVLPGHDPDDPRPPGRTP